MYDQPINVRTILILVLALGMSIYMRSQNAGANQDSDLEILSKAIMEPSLWEGTSIQIESLSKAYLLDHGVTLDLPQQFSVGGLTVELIQKNQLPLIGSAPLVQVHTLNVESDKALVRLYLRYVQDGIEKSTNTELFFVNNGANWNITNK